MEPDSDIILPAKHLKILDSLIEEHGESGAQRVLARVYGYVDTVPTIDEFIEDPEFLGSALTNERTGKNIVYPIWRSALREIYPTPYYSPYVQIIFTGAIGLGKSTVCKIGTLYDICKILMLESVQNQFELSKSTEIEYALINAIKDLAGSVLYNELMDWIMMSPFFKAQHLKAPKGFLFPHRLSLGVGSRSGHVLGKAIIGAILSEINFQNKVANQAKNNFTNTLRRMESRFGTEPGSLPGHIWIDSSKTDDDSFVEDHIAQNQNDPAVKVYDYSYWVVHGHKKGKYPSGKKFPVFIGDQSIDPYIVDSENQLKSLPPSRIIWPPIELRKHFEANLRDALRDIAGVSTIASYSFIGSASKIKQALCLKNPVSKEIIDLDFYDRDQSIISFLDFEATYTTKRPRFIHVDIGLSQDLTGIASSFIADTIEVTRFDVLTGKSIKIREPIVHTEFVMGIRSLPGQQVALYKLRDFILDLKVRGFPIALVSTDGYQSAQFLQDLTLNGVNSIEESVDKKKEPYFSLRSAILEGRHRCAYSSRLQNELNRLIENPKKVDHPADSSKDLADAVCGSVWNATSKMDSYRANYSPEDFEHAIDKHAKPRNIYESIKKHAEQAQSM